MPCPASSSSLPEADPPQKREGWLGKRIRAFLKGPRAFSPPGALFLGRSWATPGRGPGWKQCSEGGWAAPPGGPELFLPIRTSAICRDEELDQPGGACSRSEGLCVVASQIWGKATGWSNGPYPALRCLPSCATWQGAADLLLPLSQPESHLGGRQSEPGAGEGGFCPFGKGASQVPGLCSAGRPPLQGGKAPPGGSSLPVRGTADSAG